MNAPLKTLLLTIALLISLLSVSYITVVHAASEKSHNYIALTEAEKKKAAADKNKKDNQQIKLLAPLGKQEYLVIPKYDQDQGGYSLRIIEAYIASIYPYAAMILTSIAVLMIVVGGMDMVTAGGDSAKVTEGKDRIMYAILGLLLFLFSSVILWSINPNFFAWGR